MIRLSKLTDYGFVLLIRFAGSNENTWLTARDLADDTGLPLPTVSKLLKVFGRGGILTAHRGARGGYSLTKTAGEISVADIIEVVDGPIGITDCVGAPSGEPCAIEHHCQMKPHWSRISETIRKALDDVTLAELAGLAIIDETSRYGSQGCQSGFCSSVPGDNCTCGNHQHNIGDRK